MNECKLLLCYRYTKSWWILITQFILYFNGPSLLTKVLCKTTLFVWACLHVPDLAADVITVSSGATGVMTLSVLFISELFPPSARTAVAQVQSPCSLLLLDRNFSVFSFSWWLQMFPWFRCSQSSIRSSLRFSSCLTSLHKCLSVFICTGTENGSHTLWCLLLDTCQKLKHALFAISLKVWIRM